MLNSAPLLVLDRQAVFAVPSFDMDTYIFVIDGTNCLSVLTSDVSCGQDIYPFTKSHVFTAMLVFVKTITGKTLHIEVESSGTVEDLKFLIEEKEGFVACSHEIGRSNDSSKPGSL